MSRRMRITLIVAGVLALLALAALIALHVMLQPQRFTDMLRRSAAEAGLDLQLSAPAQPSLLPRPGLVLHGLELTPRGSDTPLLVAVRGRLVLPWRTLMGGPAAISRLRLDAPRLDLGALRAALAELPATKSAGASLPRIDAGIQINDGSLISQDRVLADDIQLSTGELAPGHPFQMLLSATTADGRPYRFTLDTTPSARSSMVLFDPVHAQASFGADTHAHMSGQARWLGGARLAMRLEGTADRAGKRYTLHLTVTPADDGHPMTLGLGLDGAGTHLDLALPPQAVASWWQRATGELADGATAPPIGIPPVSGHAALDTLDAGGVHVQGLTLDAGPDVPAAAGSTAPSP